MAKLSTNDDLSAAWSKTLAECERIAKCDLTEADPLDQDISKIQPPAEDTTLGDKAKKVFNRTLLCLNTFGSVIAQGASTVSMHDDSLQDTSGLSTKQALRYLVPVDKS